MTGLGDGSYLSASDKKVHFRLGAYDASTISLVFKWRSGVREQWFGIKAGARVELVEGDGEPWHSEPD